MALLNFSGTAQFGAGSISDQQVASGAGIQASKLQHAYYLHTAFGAVIGDAPANAEVIVHVANSAGTIADFGGMLNVVGSGNLTIDLLKNGVSVLSAAVTLNNSLSNRQAATGTISSASFVAGDVISIKTTVTTATGASGLAAWAGITETSAP